MRPILLAAALAVVGAASLPMKRHDAPRPARPPEAAPGRVRYAVPQTISVPGGSRRVDSMLDVRRRLSFGDYVWRDTGSAAARWIRVDLARQTVSFFRGGDEVGTAVIIYGTDGKPTPSGTFKVLARAEHHRSSTYDAEMPFTLRLTGDGVSIHASAVRSGVATHGCIGVPLDFARLLFSATRVGDPVLIMPATA